MFCISVLILFCVVCCCVWLVRCDRLVRLVVLRCELFAFVLCLFVGCCLFAGL